MIQFYLSSIIYGWIEAFAMEHGFSTGAPDFFGFRKAYHGAMLALLVTTAWATGCWQLFWWVLIEDLTFWASSKWGLSYKFKLTQDSWIAKLLGSFKYKTILVPVVHVVLFVVGLLQLIYV